jgi:hypothetical protein
VGERIEKRLARQRNFFGTLPCKRHSRLTNNYNRGRQEAMFKCDMMMNDIDDCVVKLFTATSPTAKTIHSRLTISVSMLLAVCYDDEDNEDNEDA